MNNISVLYMSYVTLLPEMELRTHVHDYWHFSLSLNGILVKNGKTICAPGCSCFPPHIPHAGEAICKEDHTAINIMFQVHNKLLYKRLEQFPFHQLRKEQLHIPMLVSILEHAHTFCPPQDLIDFAFGYYLYLLLESALDCTDTGLRAHSLSEKALNYINDHYMLPLKLEDLANHLDRSRTYTAHLLNKETGMTFMEHLAAARIKHACTMLAYSNLSLDDLAKACGFNSTSNFCRVFKASIGVTPNKYRTSHKPSDLFYSGNPEALSVPYKSPVYTYIPGAQKCIDWKTPKEYLDQSPNVNIFHPSTIGKQT